MPSSSKKTDLTSDLLLKLKIFGQQLMHHTGNFFELVYDQSLLALQTLASTFRFIVKQLDRFIDYVAEHPAWDNISTYTGELKAGIKQRLAEQKRQPYYDKILQYIKLTRFDKPIGTLLLLWPTLIALWIAAEGWPDPLVLFVFITCVVLMRSAGCAINDYADRHIDGKVKRTKERPLAAGKITEKEALLVFAGLCLVAFLLVLLMNTLTIIMSIGGVLLAASYPFMKRYHYLPQVHLGAAFGWSAPMAYAAQANEVSSITWLIFLATVLWATIYDTMYAMVDYDDDIKIGVKSTAVLFGNQDKLIIGIIQLILIFNLLIIGHRAELSGFYYLGVTAASVLAIYQQYLIKDRDRDRCFQAFLNNNWFGLVLFLGVFLDYQFAHQI